jgi:hypothetical protein
MLSLYKLENINFPVATKHIEKTDFEGNPYFNIIVMYYLSHKHDNTCVIFNEPYNVDSSKSIAWNKKKKDTGNKHKHNDICVLLPKKWEIFDNLNQTDVSLRFVEKNDPKDSYISVPRPESFWNDFDKCSKKRFIVMPFGFTCVDSGHANYLLYDKKKKSLERFEPFGYVNDKECLNPPNLDDKIRELFEENLGKDFIKEYLKPLNFMPKDNFQTIQEEEHELRYDDPVGFCSVWSAWYIDLRLSNPDIEREELVKKALKILKKNKKDKNISFTQFIRNYSNFLVEISDEIDKLY